MLVYKVSLCFVLMLCFARKVNGNEQQETVAALFGSAFEMLLNKMETLQYKLTESDQKLAWLSKTIDHKLSVLQAKTESAVKEHPDNIDGQHETDASFSGLAFELLLNKLESLQDNLIESDQKLSGLSQTIDQLTVLQTETKAAMKGHRDHIDQKLSVLDEKIIVLQTQSKVVMKEYHHSIDLKLSQQENLSKGLMSAIDQLGKNFTELHAQSSFIVKKAQESIDQKLVGATGSVKQLDESLTTLKSQTSVMLNEYKESTDGKLNQLIQSVDEKFKALLTQSNITEQSITVKHEQTQKEIQKLASKDGLILYKINSDIYYGNLSKPVTPILSCKNDLFKQSGKYLIVPNRPATPFEVYCDQSIFGGGWLVFQYRFNGSVDFYRNWEAYRNGFGSLEGEFWLGLEHLHQLTSARKYELLVELKDYSGVYVYARYDQFEIGSEGEKYALKKLGSYSGTAGYSLNRHKGMKFSTKDQDNDATTAVNCAVDRRGAWWYWECGYSNLNGIYKNTKGLEHIYWLHFKSSSDPMAYTRMSIREI